jgi:Fe2+ transport system protein FeoA
MLGQLLRRFQPQPAARTRCEACTLDACATGCRAAVLHVGCAAGEASRLRMLGLHEGACVTVVDSRNGLLLDVKGSRLALGEGIAASIRVLPLGS